MSIEIKKSKQDIRDRLYIQIETKCLKNIWEEVGNIMKTKQ